jgi:hypothetical protein
MTTDELKARLDALGAPDALARVSEAIPTDLPQAVVGKMLFVLCEDGPVSFEMSHDERNDPCFLPASMQTGPEAAAEWQAAFPEVTDLDRLRQAQSLAGQLSRTKLAALARTCLLALGDAEVLSLAELDLVIGEDPELG